MSRALESGAEVSAVPPRRRIRVGLAAKLAVCLVASTAAFFSLFGYFNLRQQREYSTSLILQSAERLTDIILRSTQYQMMHNDREALYHGIHSMGSEPGIRRIRIFNKEGRISFSTDPGEVNKVVDKVLNADLPVLLTGESGTGKEQIARYIWAHSARKGPFVKVNCAAIPSELLESELFGFERGAFTGAFRRKPGKFEVAGGGFLFLDEISELSYPLQSKLLHVLQDSSFSALGSTREVTVDVRVIAATNQLLEDLVRRGGFRDDLFFRLNVVRLHIPPLRERLDQMGALIDYFSRRFAAQYGTRGMVLTSEMKSFLYNYTWPGNIRELENVIRRATVLGDGQFLAYGQTALGEEKDGVENGRDRASVPSGPDKDEKRRPKPAPAPAGESVSLKEIARQAALNAEREAIEDVLKRTRWNRKKTAQILGVSYKTLLTKIKETGLDEK